MALKLRAAAVLLLVLLVLCGLAARGRADECTFETPLDTGSARLGFASVERVRRCFDAIPLTEQVRNSSLSVLRFMNRVYSFTDIATGSGPPFNISVDLDAELNRIDSTVYLSDYPFHEDLQLLYARLFDAHTQYLPPSPYQQFLAFRPFILAASGDPQGDANNLTIVTDGLAAILGSVSYRDAAVMANLTLPTDFGRFVGQRIVAINGMPPNEYLIRLSDFYGTYKDPSVRLNVMLEYQYTLAPFILSANMDPENYTFANGESASLPPVVILSPSWTDRTSFLNRIQSNRTRTSPSSAPPSTAPKAVPTNSATTTSSTRRDAAAQTTLWSGWRTDARTTLQQAIDAFESARPARRRAARGVLDPETAEHFAPKSSWQPPFEMPMAHVRRLLLRTEWSVVARDQLGLPRALRRGAERPLVAPRQGNSTSGDYVLIPLETTEDNSLQTAFLVDPNSSTTPVVAAVAIMPTFSPSVSLDSYLNVLFNLRQYAAQYNVTNLVVDVTNNGGGFICLAQWAAYFLSPRYENNINSAEYIFDARVPAGLGVNYLSGVPTSPAQLCGSASYTNITQAGSFTPITRGKRTSDYTALIALDECRPGMAAIHNISGQLPGGFEKIVILSDGSCGSACSFFESRLAADNGAVVVTYGGLLNRPMDTSSFGGGGVTSGWENYFQQLVNISAAERAQFPQFLSTADVSFSSSEFYLPDGTLPREWHLVQADFRLPVWPALTTLADPARFLYTPLATQVLGTIDRIPTTPVPCVTPPRGGTSNSSTSTPPDENDITSTWLTSPTNSTPTSVPNTPGSGDPTAPPLTEVPQNGALPLRPSLVDSLAVTLLALAGIAILAL